MIEIRPSLNDYFNQNTKLVNLLGGYDIGGTHCTKIRNDVGEDHVEMPMVVWDLYPLTIRNSDDHLFYDHQEKLVFHIITKRSDEVLNIALSEEVNRMLRNMDKITINGTTFFCSRSDRGVEFFNDPVRNTSVRNLYFTVRYQENEA